MGVAVTLAVTRPGQVEVVLVLPPSTKLQITTSSTPGMCGTALVSITPLHQSLSMVNVEESVTLDVPIASLGPLAYS